ncbi:MAG: response regulator, partial [bacterium]
HCTDLMISWDLFTMPIGQRSILLVDDNPQYRAAVARNLTLEGYRIIETEDGSQAMDVLQRESPLAVITDLDMRTHDEGLQLIQQIKRHHPHLSVIMVSAVGGFDEGALARQYGAMYVVSKSRIDSEIETLYLLLEKVVAYRKEIDSLRDLVEAAVGDSSSGHGKLYERLDSLLQEQDLDSGMKGIVFDLRDRLEVSDRMQQQSPRSTVDMEGARAELVQLLPEIQSLHSETQTMLAIGYHLEQSESEGGVSVSRNACFSYSFAVENEVKNRIGKRVNRFLSAGEADAILQSMYDPKIENLDIFFNQYVVRTIQGHDLDLNSDITRQVLERMLRHRHKYKPDGLKALGVMFFCFGREFTFSGRSGPVNVKNPLNLKGLDSADTMRLAGLLIRLQHLRNPFVHPEFSDREKTVSIRDTAIECLRLASRLV